MLSGLHGFTLCRRRKRGKTWKFLRQTGLPREMWNHPDVQPQAHPIGKSWKCPSGDCVNVWQDRQNNTGVRSHVPAGFCFP